jgi:glucose-6-phosphate 1-dehydrogenase
VHFRVSPAIIVIFGITGDLAQRKLLPALYHLFKHDLLDEKTAIVGITRRDVTAEEVLEKVEPCINDIDDDCDPVVLAKLKSALHMHKMSQTEPAEYSDLLKMLNGIEEEQGVCMDRLYYLSIPPQMFEPIVRNLGEQGLNKSCQHKKADSRLLVEKPFGYDLKSARELIEETSKYFAEDQIFRIDHYLAKDTVQNIIDFRAVNNDVEKIWNDEYVSNITITAFEKIDIEGRATFYEEVGALRDFVQSHLLQLLAVTTMDLPVNTRSEAVHETRLKLLESIAPIGKLNVASSSIRGQYEGYREEVQNPDSCTETFALVRLVIDNPRWRSTSFTLQTGKALSEKRTDIVATFNDGSKLAFHIQPDKGIEIVSSHEPAFLKAIAPHVARFNHAHPPGAAGPDAYERVLLDAIRGDHTLFTTSEEVLAAWKVVTGVVEAWSKNAHGIVTYPKGAVSVS